MCGFFKRNCLGFQNFLPPTQSLLVFEVRSFGDLPSWHWNPRLVGLMWGWDSLFLRYPCQMFIHHTWVRDQPVPNFSLLTSLDGCGFFNSVVVRFPFNSSSDIREWWLFYILVIIWMWLCEEVSHVCLCCHLDWMSPMFTSYSTKRQACSMTSYKKVIDLFML